MSDHQKFRLANEAGEHFEKLKTANNGSYPFAFPFRSYAVRVADCGTFIALSVWDSKGRYVTNIAW